MSPVRKQGRDALPGSPEVHPDETPAGKRGIWSGMFQKYLEVERSALEVLATVYDRPQLLESPLGKLAKVFKGSDVPPRADSPKTRGDDLLPMDLRAVEDHLEGQSETVVKATLLLVTTLNYLWLGNRDSERYRPSRRGLTKTQKVSVDHLRERESWISEKKRSSVPISAQQRRSWWMQSLIMLANQ